MQKIKLTKIFTTDKDKEGNPLKSAKGFAYSRMSIKCNEFGDKWISGFKNKENEHWKEGDEVEVLIEKKGEYLNFSVPKKVDLVDEKIEQVLNKLTSINLTLNILKDHLIPKQQGAVKTSVEYPENNLGEPKF